jgi:hypothetical protein
VQEKGIGGVMKKILVLYGVNLNMLGKGNPIPISIQEKSSDKIL